MDAIEECINSPIESKVYWPIYRCIILFEQEKLQKLYNIKVIIIICSIRLFLLKTMYTLINIYNQ